MKNKKIDNILHFTHIDSDALGCDVILKFLFQDDYIKSYYVNNKEVDNVVQATMTELLKEDEVVYDIIFITDIEPNGDSIKIILDYKEKTGCKVYGFDHHVSNDLYKDYPWFIVADTTKTLYERYADTFLDKATAFMEKYHKLSWEHDNILDEKYESIEDVDDNLAMKISATFVLYRFLTVPNNVIDFTVDVINGTYNLTLSMLVKDISCYDTWEWKNNPYIIPSKKEDRCQKLIKMIGISDAVEKVCETIKNKDIRYFPLDYIPVYEYQKYKGFEYVKRTANNVKVLNKKGIKLLSTILGINLDDVDKVFISISDNTEDINEQATFINNFLANDDTSFFMHVFIQSKTLSFRSNPNGYNVSAIAVKLGGGGHKAASGAVVESNTISDLAYLYHSKGSDMNTVYSNDTYEKALKEYMETLVKISYFKYELKKY